MPRRLACLLVEEDGLNAVEYGLLAAFVLIAAVGFSRFLRWF